MLLPSITLGELQVLLNQYLKYFPEHKFLPADITIKTGKGSIVVKVPSVSGPVDMEIELN
jgi:hypothetical protein